MAEEIPVDPLIEAAYFIISIFVILLIIGLVILIIYSIIMFFLKKKNNYVTVTKQKWEAVAKQNKPKTLGDLYLSGDKRHMGAKLGRIEGYTQVKLSKTSRKLVGKKLVKKVEGMVVRDLFIYKNWKTGWYINPLNWFESTHTILVDPNTCSPLVGDVRLQGIGLNQTSFFEYVTTDEDLTPLLMSDNLADMVGIEAFEDVLVKLAPSISTATGFDADLIKAIKKQSEVEIETPQKQG